MGYNTTVLVLNDALQNIETDPLFGKTLARRVKEQFGAKEASYVPAGGFVNAATVIESHHADSVVPVLIGGNHGVPLDLSVRWNSTNPEQDLLEQLAKKRGYRLVKQKE